MHLDEILEMVDAMYFRRMLLISLLEMIFSTLAFGFFL